MFADMYLPHVSGVTNQIELYKQWLEERGHEVIVFTWGPPRPEDRSLGIVRSPGLPWGRTGWQVPLGVSGEARRLMATVDIAHAHHPIAAHAALSRCGGAPVVFTNHTRYDLFADRYAWFIPKPISHRVVSWYLSTLSRKVTVLVPTPRIAGWVTGCGMERSSVRVFPNTIDARRFAEPSSPLTKSALGVPDDGFLLVHVGRLAAEKNLGLLAEALKRVFASRDDVYVAVIGDGPEREELESSLEPFRDRVRLLGMKTHEELASILGACDAFVTASTSETFGLVVLEAAAAGLPAVGVDSPGVGELVVDGHTGLLVAERADAMAAALDRLAGDRALAREMGGAARAAAAAYDVRTRVDELLGVYREVISAHRSGA